MYKLAVLVLLLASCSAVSGQVATEKRNQFPELVKTTQENAKAKAAADYIDQNHDNILKEWGAITEI
ncbi:MAG TPA: hypothetical protein VGN86_03430, partial [Pyrinomonadaceae bacterium]|nr:hypothetical protein [Pyrinomonadaceae bacterium]